MMHDEVFTEGYEIVIDVAEDDDALDLSTGEFRSEYLEEIVLLWQNLGSRKTK